MTQKGEKHGTPHRMRAQRLEMRIHHLAVDQVELPATELSRETHEGDLRCIRTPCEHRFAEEETTERHPVQTARQLVSLPRLNGMCITFVEQPDVCALHLRRDPRAARISAGSGTSFDHDRERT